MIAESQQAWRSARRRPARLPTKPPHPDRARVILVPLDGSEEAKAALPVAKAAAALTGASVQLVHASPEPLDDEKLMWRMGLRREDVRGAVLTGVVGDPASAMVRLATERRALLVVMSTHGRTTRAGRVDSQITEQIVQEVTCPVLLVRPGATAWAAEPCLRRMLLPLDGAPSSASVIGPALDLADRSDARVDILYVAMPASAPGEPGSLATPLYVDQPQYEWPSWAREFISRFGTAIGQSQSPASTRVFLRRGEPATEILRFAGENDADLIVLEWRGLIDPCRGRVIWDVLADTPCPVLLLRARAVSDGA